MRTIADCSACAAVSRTMKLSYRHDWQDTRINALVAPTPWGRRNYALFLTMAMPSSNPHSANGLVNTNAPEDCRHLHEHSKTDPQLCNERMHNFTDEPILACELIRYMLKEIQILIP